MADKDPALGERIQARLQSRGIETPIEKGEHQFDKDVVITSFMRIMQLGLGLDLTDDSLCDTPLRVSKMFCEEVFYGLNYDNFPSCLAVENKFHYNEMIATSCTIKSMCEHHFVPFVGKVWCAYLPKDRVLGLSKFNRVVDFFCRRPQVQERLTEQIAVALSTILETDDVAITLKAKHFCVMLRGVQDDVSETITSRLNGRFFNTPALREEFLLLTRT